MEEFASILERLQEPDPPRSALFALSNLHGNALAQWAERWPGLPIDRRLDVITQLVEMSEADFEVDFSQVFKVCLDDADPRVRTSAIEGLWEVEDVRLIRPLVTIRRARTLAYSGRVVPRLNDRVAADSVVAQADVPQGYRLIELDVELGLRGARRGSERFARRAMVRRIGDVVEQIVDVRERAVVSVMCFVEGGDVDAPQFGEFQQ